MILSLLCLVGCSGDLAVSTVLESTGGLRVGDKVLLAGREVGEVIAIRETTPAPGFSVEIELLSEHAELVQHNAVAYVPYDGPPRLLLVNPSTAGPPIADRGRLKGLSPLEIGLWRAGDAVDAAAGLVDDFTRRVDAYFEGEEWARTRADIDAGLAELATESERAASTLSEELGSLFESIQEQATREAETLADELAEIEREIEELEAEGHEDLAGAVRRLIERIEALRTEGAKGPTGGPRAEPRENAIEAD